MGTMNDSNTLNCPQCGMKLAADVPGGLCPRCVMAMNLSPETLQTGASHPISGGPAQLSLKTLQEKLPQFEALEFLGRGGMGMVYKARQKALDREVAIKVLASEWQGDSGFAARFEREAKTLAQMSHPNIVTVHDFGEADGFFYIVMEYIDGVNLRSLLHEGKLAPEQALAIVPPVCAALEYAHAKGVVHRDIKPENLLLDRDGRVKIADFGIATMVGTAGEKSGTPPYMAPEQERGHADRRADIYALGVVLYEMLTGEHPTTEVVAPSQKVQVDVKIDEMVLRALEREPERRYQTAAEFRTVAETLPRASEPPSANAMPIQRPINWIPALVLWSFSDLAFVLAGVVSLYDSDASSQIIWLALPVAVCALVLASILHYRCWKAIPERFRTTTPAKAIGFLFIPLFNFYWAFTSWPKLAEGINRWREEEGRPPRKALPALATIYAILFVCGWTLAWIPECDIVFGLADLTVFILLYRLLVKLINGMSSSSAQGTACDRL